MTNKTTKRALSTSVISLIICVVMLMGTTFAWFTDSVTSGRNTIVAGNLDVELEYSTDNENWNDVGPTTKVFKEDALFEPGYTEVVYFKVVNNGSLALKYALKAAVYSEVEGVNKDGGSFKLSDYIMVGATKDTTLAQRADAAALATTKLGEYTTIADAQDIALLKGESDVFALVLTMPTTIGNEANHNGTNIPEIELGVELVATQYTYEYDSFDDQYDKDAAYASVWDGSVDAEGLAANTDTAAKTITIKTAEQFAAFAANINAGTSYSGYTVNLTNDLDLNNIEWTVAGQTGVGAYFQGTFDGNGFTISNLFVDSSEETGANFSSGIFGFIDAAAATIKNLNVNGATVVGHHNVGVIAGYMTGEISNCTVTNAAVKATYANDDADGDKVGGIVGFLNSGSSKLLNNTVSNSIIYGNRDIGGIVGAAVTGSTLTDNRVVDTEILYVTAKDYASAGEIISGKTGVVADATNTFENVTVAQADASIEYVFTGSELSDSLTNAGLAGAGDSTVRILNDLDMTGIAWTPVNVDGYNGADVVTVEGNGNTITNLSAPLFAGGFAGESGIIIKDLTISDSDIKTTNSQGAGAFIECVDSMETITLTNCHLENSSIIVDGESRVGGLIGWTSGYSNQNDGPVKTNVTITDCSVIGCELKAFGSVGGIIGHAGASDWTYHTITNCTVKDTKLTSTDDGSWRVGVVVGTANIGEVTVNGLTSSGNTVEQTGKTAPTGTYRDLYGRLALGTTGKLTIDGTAITE